MADLKSVDGIVMMTVYQDVIMDSVVGPGAVVGHAVMSAILRLGNPDEVVIWVGSREAFDRIESIGVRHAVD